MEEMNYNYKVKYRLPKALSYDDVSLIPQYSEATSRKSCDTSIELYGKKYRLPIIPANMKASINFEKAEWLDSYGYFYILHRFYPYEEVFEWVKRNQDLNCISISVGVKQEDKEFLVKIFDAGLRVDFVTIDIAHGHSLLMKEMIEFILNCEDLFDEDTESEHSPRIIAGNVATKEGVLDLADWGADIIKIGIGQGHTCTTRLQTGFGFPMFSCIQECVTPHLREHDIKIIADGGMSHAGDVAKALVAGADMVMAGSIFARCIDSPAETISEKGDFVYKKWFGSSTYANKGTMDYDEGRVVVEPCNGMSYPDLLNFLQQHLQSSISYAGGFTLEALREVDYLIL